MKTRDVVLSCGVVVLLLALAWLMTFHLLTGASGEILRVFDYRYSLVKSTAMAVSWANGDFAGRWTPDILWGYGYPMFNFYGPLFFYFAAGLSFLFPMVLAFNIALVAVFSAAGLSMFVFAGEFWGRGGGLLAAALYLTAPYHLLNLYVRGAPAELIAYAIAPLILWAVFRLSGKFNGRVFVLGTLASSMVLLAHNISAMFFFPLFALYAVFLFVTSQPVRRAGAILLPSGMLAGGLLLSAYFWVPALLEKKFVQLWRIEGGMYDFHRHFLYLRQLLYSAWGFGDSVPGPNDAMSFMIGPLHLFLALVAAIVILRRNGMKRLHRQIWFFAVVLLVTAFMTLGVSVSLWERIPPLHFAQFPWRLLMVISLAVSFLAGGAARIFRGKARCWALAALLGLVVWVSLPLARPFGYEPSGFTNNKDFLVNTHPWDNMEYLPVGARPMPFSVPAQKLHALQGRVDQIDLLMSKGTAARYFVRVVEPSVLVYHTYYFPGWKVSADGRDIPLVTDNPLGLIVFALPPGDHQVRIYFVDTPVRRISGVVSLIAFAFLVAVAAFLLFKR